MMDSAEGITLFASSSLFIVLFINFFLPCECEANCIPSACGIISNISYPFRLKGDPKNCGDRRFELNCENNVTFLEMNSQKYYVKSINYINDNIMRIRVVDASINNNDICSFPTVSAYNDDFQNYPYYIPMSYSYPRDYIANPINFMRCPNPLKNSSHFTETTDCASVAGYTYIKVGHLKASEVIEKCWVEMIVMTSWLEFKDLNNASLSEIHESLLYGFELAAYIHGSESLLYKFSGGWHPSILDFLSFLVVPAVGIFLFLCAGVAPPVMTIFGFVAISVIIYFTVVLFLTITHGSPLIYGYNWISALSLFIEFMAALVAPRVVIFPFALWFLIYKFRRRHFSLYEAIEMFLRSDNNLAPIRYSYSDVTRMTKSFQDKLGEGGYGCVYKGKLRSGHLVAVKLLGKSGGNGQDFMNEIATIGRIHHVNVVRLVGYCAQGSKRALVFDFMPNGSLDKYLSNREKMVSLDWDTKFEIALGIARGIEYLHRGCDVQILHFDIKPHNILLDHNFVPKISDFGLAKLCSTEKDAVTMTAARGTIGYVAPELINRGIGAVSYKADVYSFGMLLIEMVGLNRDLSRKNCDSSQYFPNWIYDHIHQGKDIEISFADENEDNVSMTRLVRKMTIVALWCIQMSPNDRPSMSKVLEMLEGDVERLEIPDYPSQSAQIVVNVDQSSETTTSTGLSNSVALLHHNDIEITVQE